MTGSRPLPRDRGGRIGDRPNGASTQWSCWATPPWSTPPGPVGRSAIQAGPTSSGRWRSWSPTTSGRTCSCRCVRARGLRTGLAPDHLHGPVYLEFDEGVQSSRRSWPQLVPAGARYRGRRVHRCHAPGALLFRTRSSGRRRPGRQRGQGDQDPRRARLHAQRLRITDAAMVDVQASAGPRHPPDRSVGNLFTPRLRCLGATPTCSNRSGRSCPPGWRTGCGRRTVIWRCRF